jgi:glycosyltransferase involved in cell wall biosynthesis
MADEEKSLAHADSLGWQACQLNRACGIRRRGSYFSSVPLRLIAEYEQPQALELSPASSAEGDPLTDADTGRLLARVEELTVQVDRMEQSRSWRWTCLLRKIDTVLKTGPYVFLVLLGRKCEAMLKPILARSVPVESSLLVLPLASMRRTNQIAVVIPCHNYGRYLAAAIESVLSQDMLPEEILVVDDSSDDDTAEVAARYSAQGVGYFRGEWRNVSAARNAGAQHTKAPFLIFLDADDELAGGYVAACFAAFKNDDTVAIAYGDMAEYGDSKTYHRMPTFDQRRFDRENFISSHAMIRRHAFDLVGGYRNIAPAATEDWDLYRRILTYPFRAQKVETYVRYRVRPEGAYRTWMRSPSYSYAESAALLRQPVTVFTHFTGRTSAFDAYVRSLRALDYDRDMIRLHWLYTGTDPAFDERLRFEISRFPFGRVTYTRSPIADAPHTFTRDLFHDVTRNPQGSYSHEILMVHAYNHLVTTCDTMFALTVEEDLLLEPEALTKLMKTLDKHTVAVVAPYTSAIHDHWMPWYGDAKSGVKHAHRRHTGIEKVSGSGFGCTLFRMSVLKAIPFMTQTHMDPPHSCIYLTFFGLAKQGTILCNWDIDVERAGSFSASQLSREELRVPMTA